MAKVFYMSLPVGGVVILALILMFQPATRKVEEDGVMENIKRLDLGDAAIYIPAVIMLLLALQWGGLTHPWSSGRIIGLLVGGAVLLFVFGAWQYRAGSAGMITLSILGQRSVFLACLCAMFGKGAQTMIGLWLPEWFQVIKGASAVGSVVDLLPAMLAQCLSALVSGALISKLGDHNPWILLGTGLMSVGAGLFTTTGVTSGKAAWIGFQVIYGLDSGMIIIGLSPAIQGTLPPAETPVGIVTVTFFL